MICYPPSQKSGSNKSSVKDDIKDEEYKNSIDYILNNKLYRNSIFHQNIFQNIDNIDDEINLRNFMNLNTELINNESFENEEYLEFDYSINELVSVENILEGCRDFNKKRNKNLRLEYYENNNISINNSYNNNINDNGSDNNNNNNDSNYIISNSNEAFNQNSFYRSDIRQNCSNQHASAHKIIKKKKDNFYDFENCSTYRGEFFRDKPHGFGIIELRNGQKFHGNFIHGIKKN